MRPSLLLALLTLPASAVVNIDYVTVGNAGNAADAATGSLYGAVAYAYKIGTYEVTNAQYVQFLNAKGASNSGGIFNSSMASYGITQTGSSGSYSYSVTSGFENKPVVYVSWFDAARFTNWLGNGQGSGDMETGAYTLNGATSGIINKNVDATVWIPSESDWYKAAYYNGVSSTYSLYPNGQNSITTADANYDNSVGHSTDVGTYAGDPSSYGTFDQAGNVWEWFDPSIDTDRGVRGGSYLTQDYQSESGWRDVAFISDGTFQSASTGFRVASAIPEPSSLVLSLLASGLLLTRRSRRA